MSDDWIGVDEMRRKTARPPGTGDDAKAVAAPAGREIKVVPTSGIISYGTYARSVIKGRRRITAYFSADLFGDPVFDMLLFLFASEEEKMPVSVTACCAAAGVPPSTAARWLREMEARGMVRRQADPSNARVVHLRLSPSARSSMHSWLAEISSIPLSHEM